MTVTTSSAPQLIQYEVFVKEAVNLLRCYNGSVRVVLSYLAKYLVSLSVILVVLVTTV